MFDYEEDFIPASLADHHREEARVFGAEDPSAAWILTDFDVWEPNPFYVGPPVPHPEDDDDR